MARHSRLQTAEIAGVRMTEFHTKLLRLALDGLTQVEMAKRLGVSQVNVSYHMVKLLQCVGVKNRHDLARWALEHRVRGAAIGSGTPWAPEHRPHAPSTFERPRFGVRVWTEEIGGVRFTELQKEIFWLSLQGNTRRQMANMLGMPYATLGYYVGQLYRRLDVHDQGGLARWAAEHGVLTPAPIEAGNEWPHDQFQGPEAHNPKPMEGEP